MHKLVKLLRKILDSLLIRLELVAIRLDSFYLTHRGKIHSFLTTLLSGVAWFNTAVLTWKNLIYIQVILGF